MCSPFGSVAALMVVGQEARSAIPTRTPTVNNLLREHQDRGSRSARLVDGTCADIGANGHDAEARSVARTQETHTNAVPRQ